MTGHLGDESSDFKTPDCSPDSNLIQVAGDRFRHLFIIVEKANPVVNGEIESLG